MGLNRVNSGCFGCVWGDDYKLLPYETDSSAKEVYENKTMPQWTKRLTNAFGLYSQEYSFVKVNSMVSRPLDVADMSKKNIPAHLLHTSLMMLEDWQPGQFLQIDDIPYINWKQGDWFEFNSKVKYGYSNIGDSEWYILHTTGRSVYTGTLDGILHYNIVDIPGDGRVSHPFIQHCVIPAIDDESLMGQMVYFGNSRIQDLEKITHTPLGQQHLNRHGLKIHLFEPLCSYTTDQTTTTIYETKHTQGFYSEFTHEVDPQKLRAEELDSILEYVERNDLHKVSVVTGEYNVAKYYPYYTDRLHLVTNDLFLKTQKRIEGVNPNPNYEFERKFISLNWRYTNHRHMISTFLAQNSGYYSWYFKCEPEHLGSHQQFDLTSWENKHPEYYSKLMNNARFINETGPLTVDKSDAEANWIKPNTPMLIWPQVQGIGLGVTPALYNSKTNDLEKYYRDVFVDVVTESRYAQPTGNFSEKTFQPIQYRKPFILVAPPYTLEYVKSYGFKTFSDYWDESYDQEPDHEKRLVKIFDVIEFINNKSIQELREIYRDMVLILEHNVKVFDELFANPTYRLEDR